MTLEKEKFGAFVSALRKEQKLTQKELAQRLHTSDKAVSKWETGTCLPDVSLLMPLAEVLGVTVTELLRGERITQDLSREETEALVQAAVIASEQDRTGWRSSGFVVMVVLTVALLLFSVLPWFTYPGSRSDKFVYEQYSILTFAIYALLLLSFWGCLGKWKQDRKLVRGAILGAELCLFGVPLWGIAYYMHDVNQIQRYWNQTLREIWDHTTAVPFLIAGTWVALTILFHRELLRQWRSQILDEATSSQKLTTGKNAV